MKTLFSFFAMVIALFSLTDYSFSQNYYNTSPLYISTYSPGGTNPTPAGKHYFDLSSISSSMPDIAVVTNAQLPFFLPVYNHYRHGNWNANTGGGSFGGPNSPFFPTLNFLSEIDSNKFSACNFIKLRNQAKKDFVSIRTSSIDVYHNNSSSLSLSVQSFRQGGTASEVGEFNIEDRYEDIVVLASGGVVKAYRNLYNGFIDTNPYVLSTTSGAQIFKIRQIDDKTSPYPQQNANNRFDIITTQSNNIKIFLNNNSNGVNSPQVIDAGFNIVALEVADVNEDGYNDIVVAGGPYTSTLAKVFLNNANGTINTSPVYTSVTNFLTFSTTAAIVASDLNNDGYNDLTFVGYEGQTKVYINTKNSNCFTASPQQSISGISLFTQVDQVKSLDIYNTGGKALFYSLSGGTINQNTFDIIRLNAVTQNIAPAPPVVNGTIHLSGGRYRPKIQILNNRGTMDFQKYEIYKSNAASGWVFNYFAETTSSEFIDYSEYILSYAGIEDGLPPNTLYAVKTVDQTDLRSDLSQYMGYRVGGVLSCDACAHEEGPDNLISDPESNFDAPKEYGISNFPNPFNPSTKIYYNIPIPGNVKIEIYNSAGVKIKELLNEFKNPGNYVTDFNGADLSSGAYFYRIEAGDFIQTKKMVLIK